MDLPLLIPSLVAAALGISAGFIRWPIRPRLGVPILTSVLVATASATAMVVLFASVGFLLQQSLLATLARWCPLVPAHREVGWVVGVPAIAVTLWMGRRVCSVLSTRRWAGGETSGRRFLMLTTAEPIAYAAPGRPGCVVVSSGMLEVLGAGEREVLFAHERAHLRLRHHWYLLAGDLSVAVLPPLRNLAGQLRTATERSADEVAAEAVDGDRILVAKAIARAAMAKITYQTAVAPFSGGEVAQRVDALVGEPPSGPVLVTGATMSMISVVAAWSASTIQFHHLAELIAHVCGR